MLLSYIEKQFENGEPIFLSELPFSTKDALRQEMKKLTDEGKLIRVSNGIYIKPYKTIFGTLGKMSINKYIEKKYLKNSNQTNGYITGIGLFNKYGLTTQVPSVIEIVSNSATTKQRNYEICQTKFVVYSPRVKIDNDNKFEMEFLDILLNYDLYSELELCELKDKLKQIIVTNNININKLNDYLPLYPDKIFRNIYQIGLMNELV